MEMKLMHRYFFLILILNIAACHSANNSHEQTTNVDSAKNIVMIPDKNNFQDTIDYKKTGLFILKNKNGIAAAITNYGGRIVSLLVPDKTGKLTDVVVGFDSVKDYITSTEPYFGATIGRYGNRIAKGKFTLDGKEYKLFTNNGPNTLHGGKKGFQAVVWDADQKNDSTLELTYLSKDGEENFPGNLNVKVTYSLSGNNELQIKYEATTDKRTVINLTNHAFYNLNGEGNGTILHHVLQVNADNYTPVDATLIPTGKIETVKGTPFDFTKPTGIGSRINDNNIQLKNGNGYDHNFVLRAADDTNLIHAATIKGDRSGIVMDVYTQEPGLQFYSGNFMKSQNTFKSGAKDDFRTAFCLETQHFPDSPNQPSFPSTILDPDKVYTTISVYKFSVSK